MFRTLFYAACLIFGLKSKSHAARHVGVHAFKHLLENLFGWGRHR